MKGTSPHISATYRPALLLAVGFIASAAATYALVWTIGAGVAGDIHGRASSAWIGAAVLAGLVAVDVGVFGIRTPMWRRQTPRHWYPRFGPDTAGLLWGLDAGLIVTTFRVTSLSWAGLSLGLLGLVPWWSGLVYGVGFVVPLAVTLAIPRGRPARAQAHPHPQQAPISLLDRLHAAERWIRRAGLVVLAVGAAACAAAALGSA